MIKNYIYHTFAYDLMQNNTKTEYLDAFNPFHPSAPLFRFLQAPLTFISAPLTPSKIGVPKHLGAPNHFFIKVPTPSI